MTKDTANVPGGPSFPGWDELEFSNTRRVRRRTRPTKRLGPLVRGDDSTGGWAAACSGVRFRVDASLGQTIRMACPMLQILLLIGHSLS